MGRLIAVCKRFHPFHITSKQPSWRTTSKFRHSTKEIIDANAIYKAKTFMVINYWIFIDYLLCSTEIFWRYPPRCDFRRWLQVTSEVTIEFLVPLLVEMNHLSCDSHLSHVITNYTSKRGFQGKLETFCKVFVSVSYRNHPFDGWFLINCRIVGRMAE